VEQFKPGAAALSAVSSGVDTYKAYKAGDQIGLAIGSVSTANNIAGVGGKTVPGLGTVTSLARDSQALGTALGTGDKWTVDKALQVGAAGSLLVGKSAAASATYLAFSVAGPGVAAKSADTTTKVIDAGMAGQAWAFGKLTDTEIFKRATDRWLHIKESEEAERRAQVLYEQLRARHP
jgi:hypothetical protein